MKAVDELPMIKFQSLLRTTRSGRMYPKEIYVTELKDYEKRVAEEIRRDQQKETLKSFTKFYDELY